MCMKTAIAARKETLPGPCEFLIVSEAECLSLCGCEGFCVLECWRDGVSSPSGNRSLPSPSNPHQLLASRSSRELCSLGCTPQLSLSQEDERWGKSTHFNMTCRLSSLAAKVIEGSLEQLERPGRYSGGRTLQGPWPCKILGRKSQLSGLGRYFSD